MKVIYRGRAPPSKDLLDKGLEALGSVFRFLGRSIDSAGNAVNARYGGEDRLMPNTAWMPYKPYEGIATPGATCQIAHQTSSPLVCPKSGDHVFIAQNASVIGNVTIGPLSSIWYGAVVRGDVNSITIGEQTNIQDNVIVHVGRHSVDQVARATVIGDNVTIGHSAIIHACTVKSNSMVGMGATLLDGVVVEEGALVGAGSLVPPGVTVPSGQVWAGNPARYLRDLTAEEAAFIAGSAKNYAALASSHGTETEKSWGELLVDEAIRHERGWREGTEYDSHHGIYRDPETQMVLSDR